MAAQDDLDGRSLFVTLTWADQPKDLDLCIAHADGVVSSKNAAAKPGDGAKAGAVPKGITYISNSSDAGFGRRQSPQNIQKTLPFSRAGRSCGCAHPSQIRLLRCCIVTYGRRGCVSAGPKVVQIMQPTSAKLKVYVMDRAKQDPKVCGYHPPEDLFSAPMILFEGTFLCASRRVLANLCVCWSSATGR